MSGVSVSLQHTWRSRGLIRGWERNRIKSIDVVETRFRGRLKSMGVSPAAHDERLVRSAAQAIILHALKSGSGTFAAVGFASTLRQRRQEYYANEAEVEMLVGRSYQNLPGAAILTGKKIELVGEAGSVLHRHSCAGWFVDFCAEARDLATRSPRALVEVMLSEERPEGRSTLNGLRPVAKPLQHDTTIGSIWRFSQTS